jgi:hypothetical protein
MHERNGARELGLVIGTLAVLVHFLDGLAFWAVAGLMVATAAASCLYLLAEWRPWRVPLDRLARPPLAAFAAAGIARLVNPVPWLVLVFAGTWIVVAWVVAVDTEPVAAAPEEAGADTAVEIVTAGGHPRPLAARVATLGVAFLAFAAVGGFVPGSLPGGARPPEVSVLTNAAIFDLVIGGLTGYLLAAVRPSWWGDRLSAFLLYAAVLAAAGALLRLIAMPRLLGPAILTLLAYLLTAAREAPAPFWHSRRLVGEMTLLGLAGCAVIVLGLLTR